MERYNKIYLALWLLLSALALFLTVLFLLDPLTRIFDNVAVWFFLLFFCSEVGGFILSSLVIDHAG